MHPVIVGSSVKISTKNTTPFNAIKKTEDLRINSQGKLIFSAVGNEAQKQIQNCSIISTPSL